MRSALDLFAYTRDRDDALVIGAGLPADWLQGQGVTIAGLRTPYGALAYTLRRDKRRVYLDLQPGLHNPPGGIVLQLPRELTVGMARIDGTAAAWRGYELRIDHAPARVVIDAP